MIPKRPVIVFDLFPEERGRLVELLLGLSPEQFRFASPCPGWSVHDLVAHVIGDNLASLSGGRDAHSFDSYKWTNWQDLVTSINQRNEEWVVALRQLSPRVLTDLLQYSGEQLDEYFASLDPMQPGPNVAWAGEGPMPMWLHVAREYTERWIHQAQIREAVGAPLLDERRFLHPVLDTFVHALPVTYRDIEAPSDTHVVVEITGDAGGSWSLIRHDDSWTLMEGVDLAPSASVKLDDQTAWRLWTRATAPDVARRTADVRGDEWLGEPVLRAVSMIV